MSQWVKVEFYGKVPNDEIVLDADLLVVGGTLMEAFGFTHLDGLTVTAAASHGDPS